MSKHLIIYHGKCDDGFGAAWAAHSWLKYYEPEAEIECYPATYGKQPPFNLITKETKVHILDFSYDSPTLQEIYDMCESLVLLDHHKTAVERFNAEPPEFFTKDFSDKAHIEFDMNHSGAMLAWRYYGKFADVPDLIRHIEDNDLWKFALPNTKEFIIALRSYPQTFDSWQRICDSIEHTREGYRELIKEGETIQRYYNQKMTEIIDTQKEDCTILNIKGLCCNAPKMFASDIGNILADISGTFGATWFKRSDGAVEWSLRSIGDFDVSVLAKEFGGGGHKNAAGFTLINDGEQEGIQLWRS